MDHGLSFGLVTGRGSKMAYRITTINRITDPGIPTTKKFRSLSGDNGAIAVWEGICSNHRYYHFAVLLHNDEVIQTFVSLDVEEKLK